MKTSFIKLLLEFGFDVALFMAGTAGAIAFLTKSLKLSRIQKFTSVLSGGFSANYLTPVVAHWFNLDHNLLYGVAFLLGYGGLKFVETVFVYFSNKFTNNSVQK